MDSRVGLRPPRNDDEYSDRHRDLKETVVDYEHEYSDINETILAPLRPPRASYVVALALLKLQHKLKPIDNNYYNNNMI